MKRRIDLNREMFSYVATLTLTKFQEFYSGQYKISVSNEEGIITAETSLRVKKNDLSKSLPIINKDDAVHQEKVEKSKIGNRRSFPLKPKVRSDSHKSRQLKPRFRNNLTTSTDKSGMLKLDLTELSSRKSNTEKISEGGIKKYRNKPNNSLDDTTIDTISMFSDCETVETDDCSFLNSFSGSIPENFSPRSTSTQLPTKYDKNDLQDTDAVFETFNTIEPKTINNDKNNFEYQTDPPKIVIDDCTSISTPMKTTLAGSNDTSLFSESDATKDISFLDETGDVSTECESVATKDISFLDETDDVSTENESSMQMSILLSSSSASDSWSVSSCTTLKPDSTASSSDELNGVVRSSKRSSRGKKDKFFNDELTESVFGTLGEKLVLCACSDNKKQGKHAWTKDDVDIKNLRKKLRLSYQVNENSYSLTINNFQVEHTGKYAFVAESNKKQTLQQTFDVKVKRFKTLNEGKS